MTDKPGKKIRITEAELIQLMQRLPKTSSDFGHPEDSIITKYLLCEATDSEKTVIEEAMLNSAEFRRELLQLAKDIDSLADAQSRPAQSTRINAPDRQAFLQRYGTKPAKPDFWKNLVGYLKRMLIPQIYVPAVATVATVFIVFFITQEQASDPNVAAAVEWRLDEAGLDRNLLRSKHVRGPSRPLISEAKADARSAALSEMRELLTYSDGAFELNPAAEEEHPPDEFRLFELQITDSVRQYTESFSAFVPIVYDSLDPSMAVWLLTLPSKSLYQIDLQADTLLVAWPPSTDDHGCLVVTYRDSEGFRALRGHTIDLRD